MVVSDGVAGSFDPSKIPGASVSRGAAPLMLTQGSSSSIESGDSAAKADAGSSVGSGQLISYSTAENIKTSTALVARRLPPKVPEPQWHAPWELSAVVSGHLGWVRCIAFDPSNEWFATGSADRTIKVAS